MNKNNMPEVSGILFFINNNNNMHVWYHCTVRCIVSITRVRGGLKGGHIRTYPKKYRALGAGPLKGPRGGPPKGP